MSFFYTENITATNAAKRDQKRIPVETLQEMGCKACSLDSKKGLSNAKMKPHGDKKAVFYILGASPTVIDDQNGEHFSGSIGDYLDEKLPTYIENRARYDYVARCTSTIGEASALEIACCHNRVNEDIEKTKPYAIIGFGAAPLYRFCGERGIQLWRGKRFPVRIGKHTCWYYPVSDPSWLVANRHINNDGYVFDSTGDKTFVLDLEKAVSDYKREHGKLPEVDDDLKVIYKGVQILEDYSENGYKRLCKWLKYMEKQEQVGLDYETQLLRPYLEGAQLLTCAISNGEKTYSFPLNHPKAWTKKLYKKVRRRFKKFLINSNVKIAHNLSMELEWSGHQFGVETIEHKTTQWTDTMAQAYILDQKKRKKGKTLLDLDSIVFMKFGIWIKSLYSLDKKNMIDNKVAIPAPRGP